MKTVPSHRPNWSCLPPKEHTLPRPKPVKTQTKYRAGSSIIDHIDHRSPVTFHLVTSHLITPTSFFFHALTLLLDPGTIRRSSLIGGVGTNVCPVTDSLLSHAFPTSVFGQTPIVGDSHSKLNTMLLPAYSRRKNNTGRRRRFGR